MIEKGSLLGDLLGHLNGDAAATSLLVVHRRLVTDVALVLNPASLILVHALRVLHVIANVGGHVGLPHATLVDVAQSLQCIIHHLASKVTLHFRIVILVLDLILL